MTEILLVRHGETDWNREQRWQGHADRPLNDRGREQARELANSLAGERLDAIYASDLARARETAEIVGARLRLPVVTLPGLREFDFGEFEGLTTPEIEARFPGAVARFRETGDGWPGGETPEEMSQRVVAAVSSIAERHPGGRVLVVAHGGPIRALGAAAAELDYLEYRRRHPFVANCSVTRLGCESAVLRPID